MKLGTILIKIDEINTNNILDTFTSVKLIKKRKKNMEVIVKNVIMLNLCFFIVVLII